MIEIEEIPLTEIDDFWSQHLKYLIEDDIISDPEDIAYFSGGGVPQHYKSAYDSKAGCTSFDLFL